MYIYSYTPQIPYANTFHFKMYTFLINLQISRERWGVGRVCRQIELRLINQFISRIENPIKLEVCISYRRIFSNILNSVGKTTSNFSSFDWYRPGNIEHGVSCPRELYSHRCLPLHLTLGFFSLPTKKSAGS